jgi:AbrB family looped-hinge helix DNA binding protein
VTSKGQTVVPKTLRERFHIKSGATLDWQEEGQSLRVIRKGVGQWYCHIFLCFW